MKYLHRTLSSELDGKWQVVEETERARIGPFEAPSPQINFMYHLGFKPPPKPHALQVGELIGCFNWAPPNLASLETGIGSLLPPPDKSIYFDTDEANQISTSRLESWSDRNKHFGLDNILNVEWFTSGSNGFIDSLSRSLASQGDFSDYWQECDELRAASMVQKLLSSRPNFFDFPSSIEADVQRLDIASGNYYAASVDREAAKSIQEAIFHLAKLGPPRSTPLSLDTPIRCFICANIAFSPFEMNQHYAVVLLALDRLIVLTWKWDVPEHAFENPESSIVL